MSSAPPISWLTTPVLDKATGHYDLYPVWPAYEGDSTTLRRNPIFELGYWRVALEWAQQWRLHLGLEREPHWDNVAAHLAPLPQKDGLYIYSADRPDTYTARNIDHLDIIIGIAGMLPPFPGLDPATARRTVEEAAGAGIGTPPGAGIFVDGHGRVARGQSQAAVDALLNPSSKNYYDERGICTGGPGPLSARQRRPALCRGDDGRRWDGAPNKNAPGFPDDGSWTVRWEDLKPRPLTEVTADGSGVRSKPNSLWQQRPFGIHSPFSSWENVPPALYFWRTVGGSGTESFVRRRPHRQHELAAGGDFIV